MSSTDLDDYTRSQLTPEELAAIEDDTDAPVLDEDPAVGDDDEGEGDTEDSDESVAPGDPESAADDVPEAATPEADAAETPEPTAAPAPAKAQDPEPFRPQYVAATPEGYEQQLLDIKKQSRELNTKLYSGEIDADTYGEQLDALNDKREALLTAKIKAELSSEMSAQTTEQEFQYEINRFIKRVAQDEGINYSTDKEKAVELDAFMRALAANPGNADKSMSWFLDEAHRRVKMLSGDAPAAAAVPQPKKTTTQRKPALDKVAPSLALVPGSDGPGDIESEFSQLDGLSGLDLEDAIARMTPAQRARFEQAA